MDSKKINHPNSDQECHQISARISHEDLSPGKVAYQEENYKYGVKYNIFRHKLIIDDVCQLQTAHQATQHIKTKQSIHAVNKIATISKSNQTNHKETKIEQWVMKKIGDQGDVIHNGKTLYHQGQ